MAGNQEQLNDSFMSVNSKIGLEEEERKKLNIELIESKSQVEHLSAKLKLFYESELFQEADKEMTRLTKENKELNHNLAKVLEENKKLEKHNIGLINTLDKITKAKDQYDENNAELTNKLNNLENKGNELEKQNREIKILDKELQSELDTKTEKLEETNVELQKAVKANTKLQIIIQNLKLEKKEINESNNKISDELNEEKEKNKLLNNKLNANEKELAKLKRIVSDLESEITKNNEINAAHLTDYKKLTTELINIKEEFNTFKNENESLKINTISNTQLIKLPKGKIDLENEKLKFEKNQYFLKYQSKNGKFKSFLKWITKKIFRIEIFKEWNRDNITKHPKFGKDENIDKIINDVDNIIKSLSINENSQSLQSELVQARFNTSIEENFEVDTINSITTNGNTDTNAKPIQIIF